MHTAAEQAATAAAAGYWVDQAAAAAAQVTTTSTAATSAAWQGFAAWYDAAAVAAKAAEAAALSMQGQEAVSGLFTEYVAQVTALLRGDAQVRVPQIPVPTVRNGADPIRVHARPATTFRETFALTGDEQVALGQSMERALQLVETDIMLAARQAQMETMEQLGLNRYRRVLRPELSEQGPCGLCVVAADRIYKVKDLMPIHGRCKCETIPVVDGQDVGARLNRDDLRRLYAAAGDSTAAADLKRVRVQVNEHGELGPVLTVRGQKFTGPDDLGRPPGNPDLVKERLGKLQTVLDSLMDRSSAGEDLDGPLAYQREQIARTARRVAAAA